jgi:hypothetical protein
MSNRNHQGLSRVVCVIARFGIIAALYVVAFLAPLQLAAALPGPWPAVGVTALVLVATLAACRKLPGRGFRLESLGLGYQPGGAPRLSVNRRVAAARSQASECPILHSV